MFPVSCIHSCISFPKSFFCFVTFHLYWTSISNFFNEMDKILFQEEQKFSQWWLWIILMISFLAVIIPFAAGIYTQEVLHKPFGNNPTDTGTLIITFSISLIIISGIIFLFAKSRLKTTIDNQGISVRFFPFINKWKRITPGEIEKWEVRNYNAILEYGGYGVKTSLKRGKVYNVSGNVGLQLHFKNGKKLLIGTQKKQAISYAMAKLMNTE